MSPVRPFPWSATNDSTRCCRANPKRQWESHPISNVYQHNLFPSYSDLYCYSSVERKPRAPMTCSIVVKSNPDVSFNPPPQTLCSGDPSFSVILTSSVSNTTFVWKATSTGPIMAGSFMAGGTGDIPIQNITNSGAIPGTVTFAIGPTATFPGQLYLRRRYCLLYYYCKSKTNCIQFT